MTKHNEHANNACTITVAERLRAEKQQALASMEAAISEAVRDALTYGPGRIDDLGAFVMGVQNDRYAQLAESKQKQSMPRDMPKLVTWHMPHQELVIGR